MFQMQTRGEGVKKSDNFVDIINGSPLTKLAGIVCGITRCASSTLTC